MVPEGRQYAGHSTQIEVVTKAPDPPDTWSPLSMAYGLRGHMLRIEVIISRAVDLQTHPRIRRPGFPIPGAWGTPPAKKEYFANVNLAQKLCSNQPGRHCILGSRPLGRRRWSCPLEQCYLSCLLGPCCLSRASGPCWLSGCVSGCLSRSWLLFWLLFSPFFWLFF